MVARPSSLAQASPVAKSVRRSTPQPVKLARREQYTNSLVPDASGLYWAQSGEANSVWFLPIPLDGRHVVYAFELEDWSVHLARIPISGGKVEVVVDNLQGLGARRDVDPRRHRRRSLSIEDRSRLAHARLDRGGRESARRHRRQAGVHRVRHGATRIRVLANDPHVVSARVSGERPRVPAARDKREVSRGPGTASRSQSRENATRSTRIAPRGRLRWGTSCRDSENRRGLALLRDPSGCLLKPRGIELLTSSLARVRSSSNLAIAATESLVERCEQQGKGDLVLRTASLGLDLDQRREVEHMQREWAICQDDRAWE